MCIDEAPTWGRRYALSIRPHLLPPLTHHLSPPAVKNAPHPLTPTVTVPPPVQCQVVTVPAGGQRSVCSGRYGVDLRVVQVSRPDLDQAEAAAVGILIGPGVTCVWIHEGTEQDGGTGTEDSNQSIVRFLLHHSTTFTVLMVQYTVNYNSQSLTRPPYLPRNLWLHFRQGDLCWPWPIKEGPLYINKVTNLLHVALV